MPRGPRIPELAARAAALVKTVGFEPRYVSMQSEATYYGLPGCRELLRISCHAGGVDQGRDPVIARLTFVGTRKNAPGTMRISEGKFLEMVASAVGFYFLRRAGISTR